MNKPVKIAALDSNLSVADKVVQMRAVGKVMSVDIDQVNAHDLALSSTKAVKAEEKKGSEVYTTSTDLLEKKFPGDEIAWKKYSAKLTLSGSAAVLPDAVKGGSVAQSPFEGRGIMHFNHLKKVDFYKVMESTGDSADLTTYYPANPSTFDSSAGGEVFPKVLGKPTFWIVIAHNHAGDGPPSAPFTNTIH
jgi:hypothetical protein